MRWLLIPLLVLLLAPLVPLEALVTRLADLGTWSWPIYVLVYALATVAALPVSLLAACAGFLFAPGPAMLALVAGAVLGASLAFALARTALRERARGWLSRHPRLQRFDAAVAARGPVVVALARVTPGLPFGLMNYLFGLSSVRPATFVGFTLLGVLPGSALNAVGWSTLAQWLRGGSVPPAALVALGLALVLCLALGRYAQRVFEPGHS